MAYSVYTGALTVYAWLYIPVVEVIQFLNP